MKQLIVFLALIVIAVTGFSQSNTIENIITENHIEIPGTKLLMIKPDSTFTIATEYTGLTNKQLEAGINITELPMSFGAVLPMFSKDIPSKDAKLILEKDLKMNGYSAKLYKTTTTNKSSIDKLLNPDKEGSPIVFWLLIYGNENICFTVAATYPTSKDNALSDKMQTSLLSFIYLKDKVVDPLEGLVFKINLNNAPLKFASTLLQTGVIFNTDGKFPSDAADRTSFSVMIIPIEIDAKEQKDMAIKTVKNYNNKDVTLKEVNPITLDGLHGYEVIGYEKKNGKDVILNYAVTLFDKERYFILHGLSEKNYLDMFKRISRTFVLKK